MIICAATYMICTYMTHIAYMIHIYEYTLITLIYESVSPCDDVQIQILMFKGVHYSKKYCFISREEAVIFWWVVDECLTLCGQLVVSRCVHHFNVYISMDMVEDELFWRNGMDDVVDVRCMVN